MARKRWHVLRCETGQTLTLARQVPVRFDVRAETLLPAGSALRLAHQIRQDVWRALRMVRGFSPAVHLRAQAGGWHVTAGGRLSALGSGSESGPGTGLVSGPAAGLVHVARTRIEDVLEDPARRARWIRCARQRAEDTT